MKKVYTVLFVFLVLIANTALHSQTTVFTDDFSTDQSATWTTSGQIGTSSWNISRSGADWGGRRNTSPAQLELTNDAGGTSNVAGWVFAYVATSGFSSPYNATLSSNPGLVTWTFNMRQPRSDPAGFGSGNYGAAFILAGTSTTSYDAGTGYAVAIGQSGSTDPIRLVKYSTGITTLTNIITSNTSGLTDFGTEYLSIKVTYNPINDQWELFLRNDGTSAFADPTTGTLTSQGTATDNSYTATALDYLGGHWQGSTAGSQTAFFDNVKVTTVSAGSANLTVDPSSLTGFSYVAGSGPSTSQSYQLSGSNLTGFPGDITITAPANYEVSTDNSSFGASKTVAYTTATLDATTIWVRLKTGLSVGTYNGETVSNAGGGASTVNVTCSGTVYKTEPTNHVTDFSSAAGTPSHSAINITWTDASGGTLPDGYLIKASDVGYGSITPPVDGTAEVAGALVGIVAQGVGTVSFTGLNPSTTYYFKIYPYTNSGTAINYKTEGIVPQTSLLTTAAPPATSLLIENFNYTASTLLTANGWTAHSGGGTEPITVNSGGLTYAGYPSSGIGNAALVDNNGEDIYRSFSEQASGQLYISFLINVASIFDGYFFHLAKDNATFAGRVFIAVSGAGYKMGLSNTSTASYNLNPTVLDLGTTYLCVIKYDVSTTGACSLWVYSSGVPESEIAAGAPEVTAYGTGVTPISRVALRQYSASQNIIIDGIRVADRWGEAPLPVELTSFTAKVIDGKVNLNWSTATEVNNFGFEIERSLSSHSSSLSGHSLPNTWEVVGFVSGAGNSNSVKEYSYTDLSLNLDLNLNLRYRLKQIDNDGSFAYSKEVEVLNSKPSTYQLSQNFPNPFNPSTVISYQLPITAQVTLKVFDVLGNEVASLVNQQQDAGSYNVTLDASSLASGTYIYRLIAGDFVSTKKLVILK